MATLESQATYYSQSAKLVIYAEGEFGGGQAKTAEGVIRYGVNPIVAVVDSTQAGKTVGDIMDISSNIPVVSSLNESLKFKPDALLLGTAYSGGKMPQSWKPDILLAIHNGLDIINGLHDFLADDPDIARAAKEKQIKLLDVRRQPEILPVASGRCLSAKSFIVLTVGSDCSVGKMTASLEMIKVGKSRGLKSGFVATGQTGIMIAGNGIAIDRVIGDFMAGAVEQMVMECAPNHDFVFVEGQGSLIHPGFSGVTLALLHGTCPHAMVLCHKATRTEINRLPFSIPPLSQLIPVYEDMASHLRKAKVVAIALNTSGLDKKDAQKAIQSVKESTGLPCCDPVRDGAEVLFEAILSYKETLNEHHQFEVVS